MIRRYVVFVFALIAIVALAVAMREPLHNSWKGHVDHGKYLKFSHRFHVKDQGIACEDCHLKVKASTNAADNLFPDHEACKTCHEDKVDSACAFCHVNPDNIEPIPHPAREMIFSHQLHADSQKIACQTCHAGIDSVEVASEENLPSMAVCMDCHTQKHIAAECATCHRDFAGLIPPDHLRGDFKKDHRELTRLGEQRVSCAMCHEERFCQDCHSYDELKGFESRGDLMTEPAPRTPLRDSPKELKLQAVHDLNYRFTHGIDARSKKLDCGSCHNEETFCATCHQAGGNLTQGRLRPATHDEPMFTTLGKGSGGGRHAELARRDLEACMACHDVQGQDPTCALCHTENGSVR